MTSRFLDHTLSDIHVGITHVKQLIAAAQTLDDAMTIWEHTRQLAEDMLAVSDAAAAKADQFSRDIFSLADRGVKE